jgi:hypothetical protein
MKQLKCTFFLFVLCLSLFGQDQKHSVYFATAEHSLTELSKATLDECVKQFLALEGYTIEILAHTDDRGKAAYNHALASRRAAAVQDYLATKGVFIKKITVNSFGESKPSFSNADEDGRKQNRRVDVILKPISFETMEDVFEHLTAQRQQTFIIAPNETTTITGEKGTIITFPAGALEFEDGSGTPTTAITIYLEEAYELGDFLAMNLTTTSNGEILQTGGTIHLTASSNEKPLRIKDGESLELKMPTSAPMADMELFVGERDANSGNMNWSPTKQPFFITSVAAGNTNDNTNIKKEAAEQEYVELYLKSFEEPKNSEWVFMGEVPKTLHEGIIYEYKEVSKRYPKKPVKPDYFKQKEPVKPIFKEIEYHPSVVKKILLGKKGIAKQKAKMEAEKAQKDRKQLKTYEKQLKRYKVEKAKNLADSTRYEGEFLTYKTKQLEPWEARRDTFLARLTRVMVIDSSLNYDPVEWLKGTKIVTPNVSNEVIGGSIDFLKMNEERLENIQQAGNAGEQISNTDLSFYAASITSLGYMNCDRFMKMPEKLLSELAISKYGSSGRVMVALPEYKSLLCTYDKGYWLTGGKIAKGTAVKIVGFKVEKGQIFLANLNSEIGDEEVFKLTYKPVTFKELETELQQM